MTEPTIQKSDDIRTSDVATFEATREPDRAIAPAVDIYETKGGLVVLADLPGVSREQITIGVEDDVLTIKAVGTESNDEPTYREFRLANYFRQFRLGEKIDRNKIGADYKNGVLRLTLPFAAEVLPRQIEVRVA